MFATLCASYAFMLPIATPPNVIAMYGLFFNIIGIILIVLIANFYWINFNFNRFILR